MKSPDQKVQSVEAFQRNIEPAIVAARNELMTADNFMAYKNIDHIGTYTREGSRIYSFHSRLYFFANMDTDAIRATYNSHLEPLGFKMTEKRWTTEDGIQFVDFSWTNDQYQAVVSSTTIVGEQTAVHYYVLRAPSDGSTDDPKRLIDLPGRVPDWFDPSTPPAGHK